MGKAEEWEVRARRRDFVKRHMALGMGRAEITELVLKEGTFGRGEVSEALEWAKDTG